MKEITGDIWDYHKQGHWIVITTNGYVKEDGSAMMDRGVALQAKQRFPALPIELGEMLNAYRLQVTWFPKYKIITFPVKHSWWESANLQLIRRSCIELQGSLECSEVLCQEASGNGGTKVYMVRPGCGNGQLDWVDVKPILEKYLDDRFVVVERR